MNPPGKRPEEANFSLYSTCKGMKSVPGVASLAAVTVASKKVSPTRRVTDPSACLANFPVSSVISRPSDSSIRLIIGFIINKISYFFYVKFRQSYTKFWFIGQSDVKKDRNVLFRHSCFFYI